MESFAAGPTWPAGKVTGMRARGGFEVDIGRPHDHGYPIRGVVFRGLLYLRNFPARAR